MRIIYHLGAHCTDEERLITCLWKNRVVLGQQGIVVPAPTRYRTLLRDTAMTLKGRAASRETQALVLEQIMDEVSAERLILGWDNFMSYPQWVVKDRLYPAAAERVRAFAQIFPEVQAEFHISIRNLATFLPALFAKQRGKSYEDFMGSTDPRLLSWSRLVEDIRRLNPDVPLTIWSDEDTPLIWPEVLQAVTGHAAGTVIEGMDELLEKLMSPDGISRMRAYLAQNPPATVMQRRRVVSAFLDKFALPEQLSLDVELPGWTEDLVDELTDSYEDDMERLSAMPGVTFLSA